jgi:hypothetical protein
MKSQLKVAGLTAVLATSAVQAEVKINDNLSFDGYVIGAGVVTEGTPAKNGPHFGKSGVPYDSAYVALNGKYGDFSGKVSLYSFNPFDGSQGVDNVGVLDAYVTYKIGDVAITGGKYLGWLGFESFHSPNNAFISYGLSNYASPWATGAKVDYSGEGFSTGVSVRDSQISTPSLAEHFFEGDGEFDNDIGYEAYFLYSGIEKLTVFLGAGFEDVDEGDQGNTLTTNVWVSYAVTDKFSLGGEYAAVEDVTNSTWLLQGTYVVTDKVSVAGRVTATDGDNGAADGVGYGIASTYTITPNFSIKGEVTKTDFDGGDDPFSYALQGLFRF